MKDIILFLLGALISYSIVITLLNQNNAHMHTGLMPIEPLQVLREQEGILYSNDLLIRYTYDDISCMTANIFFEGRNQETNGQLLIGQTVLNRYTSIRFKNTICGVITDGKYKNGYIVKNKCHYSWFCDGIGDRPNLNLKQEATAWETANKLAKGLLSGEMKFSSTATHYHTKKVKPSWIHSTRMIYLTTIQNHMAYKEI